MGDATVPPHKVPAKKATAPVTGASAVSSCVDPTDSDSDDISDQVHFDFLSEAAFVRWFPQQCPWTDLNTEPTTTNKHHGSPSSPENKTMPNPTQSPAFSQICFIMEHPADSAFQLSPIQSSLLLTLNGPPLIATEPSKEAEADLQVIKNTRNVIIMSFAQQQSIDPVFPLSLPHALSTKPNEMYWTADEDNAPDSPSFMNDTDLLT
ncbi:hypothetical protein BYT27DRAFT_7255015 [Phlegmacium glaucopus]|nr:hypothetical protein BYT27DRAFT_7255015 [Phlegmacium glaucopus]